MKTMKKSETSSDIVAEIRKVIISVVCPNLTLKSSRTDVFPRSFELVAMSARARSSSSWSVPLRDQFSWIFTSATLDGMG